VKKSRGRESIKMNEIRPLFEGVIEKHEYEITKAFDRTPLLLKP
jgi:hypothetical protein